jgi:GntR family transcriptional regulator, sialic acid-inducible nan operon repressor
MKTESIRHPARAGIPGQVSWPIRRRKLSEEAAFRLEAMIRDGTFPPGTMLPPERELMKVFSVGRASIREALFALSRMGLVELRNGERARVTTPTPQTLISELAGAARHFLSQPNGGAWFQEARGLFEIGIARIAAERASDDEIALLKHALDANTAARGDACRFERTDVAFHYSLAAITGNPIFTAVHDALVEWLTSQRTLTLRVPGAETCAHASHCRIFDAVAARDPHAAAKAMQQHLEEVAGFLKRAPEGENGSIGHTG